jgi:VWFA-related protein
LPSFALTTVLRELQTFTQDKANLLAALNDKAGGPQQTPLGTEGDERAEMGRDLARLKATGTAQPAIEVLRHSYQDQISVHRDQRVKMTLEAFQQLSRYLASIPGKKNLLWFSATFPFVPSPETVSSTGAQNGMRSGGQDYSEEIRKTADLMAANRIAVFPIDVRGLMVQPSFDLSRKKTEKGPQEIQEFETETAGEHDTMNALAQETGGRAIYNTNDLQGAIDQVIHTGPLYYTLRYSPANKTLDNQLRHIDVKVDRNNVRLAFHHEYYASSREGVAGKDHYNPVDFFHAAMQKGYPESSQIVLKVRVNSSASLAENVGLGAGEAGKSKGTTSHIGIDIAAAIAAMQTQRASDDSRRGELVIGVVAYGEHGEVLNSQTKQGDLTFTPSEYAHVLESGFLFHLDIDVPHGASCIRVGVFDPLSASIGTVEIPYSLAGK